MTKVLKNVVVDFASLVDEPANPQARILLYKRAEPIDKYIRAEGGQFCVYSKDGKKIACHGTREKALAQLRAIEANKQRDKEDEMSEKMLKADGDQPQEPPTPQGPAPEPAPAEPAPEGPAPDSGGGGESVSKAAYLELQKKVAAAEAQVRVERDHRLTTEAIQKARADYPLVADPTVLGPIVKRATDALSADDMAELTRVLKAANEQLRQSSLFGEIGRSGATAEVSATETLMKSARALVDEGKAPDIGAALDRVTSDPSNRKLVEQYRVETLRRN